MTISLSEFISQLGSNPALLITVILTLGVILVNGWTDAPNAIATCVSTRALRPKPAILMAAVFNFLGVLVMTMINATVAYTIYSMVDFGGDPHEALVALCAAMVAIVTWATVAWLFGIPTSESHALIAGLSGAAIAMRGMGQGLIRPCAFHRAWVWTWMAVREAHPPPLQIQGPAQDRPLFPLRADRRGRGNVFYAWGAGRPEIHGCFPARYFPCQRTGERHYL